METKRNKETKNRARWGTIDWIKENRYSSMDRKRRARVRKAIGEDAWKAVVDGPHVCCVVDRLEKLITVFGLELGKKNERELGNALRTVSEFEWAMLDEAVGVLLARAWGFKR